MTTTYPTQASSTFSVTFGGDLDEEFDAPAASAMCNVRRPNRFFRIRYFI